MNAVPSVELTKNCPVCGSNDTHYLFFAIDVNIRTWSYYRCRACKSIFLFPYHIDEHDAYNEQYYNLLNETKFSVSIIERMRDVFAAQRARRLSRLLPQKARILDVGCGDGRLLFYLSKFSKNYELHGTELLPQVALRAKRRVRHRAWIHTVETLKPFFPDAHFDAITCIHVFEHLPDPNKFLFDAFQILKPGGVLLIEYPDVSSAQARLFGRYWFHLDPPRHVQMMPSSYLIPLLKRLGFELIHTSSFSAEQGVFGWIQSMYNLLMRRDAFFEMQKRKYTNKLQLFALFFITLIIFPVFFCIEYMFARLKKGSVVIIVARKYK